VILQKLSNTVVFLNCLEADILYPENTTRITAHNRTR
jgi:hypothetical protein